MRWLVFGVLAACATSAPQLPDQPPDQKPQPPDQPPEQHAEQPLALVYKSEQQVHRDACNDGAYDSCSRLTLIYGNRFGEDTMRTRFSAECEEGDALACYELGWRYMMGVGGLDKKLDLGRAALLRACELGLARGCYDIAQSYRFGKLGSSEDPAAYKRYIGRACDKGDRAACDEL